MNPLQKSILLCFPLLFSASGFADNLILDNLTSYPQNNQNSKMAIQWANTAKEVEEGNQALIHGSGLHPNTLRPLTQSGKINIDIPQKAEYFRVLAWSNGDGEPDLHTNWVQIIPSKTYKLETDHLIPCVLMPGMGC